MNGFSKIEQEAIILYAILDMIGDMVNFGIFMPLGKKIENTNLMFKTRNEARLFNILLTDFLSQPGRKGKDPLPFDLAAPAHDARPSDKTYLFYLRYVCGDPQLGPDATMIFDVVERFANWLETSSKIEGVWLGTIGKGADLSIERMKFLKICGNIAKHNFARLEDNVRKLRKILADNKLEIDEGEAYASLPDFYEWFHDNIFIYHSSTIAEFLNDLRYAIWRYMQPELARAYQELPEPMLYRFDVPEGIQRPIARSMYWDLMNVIRKPPYFPKFTVSSSFKAVH